MEQALFTETVAQTAYVLFCLLTFLSASDHLAISDVHQLLTLWNAFVR